MRVFGTIVLGLFLITGCSLSGGRDSTVNLDDQRAEAVFDEIFEAQLERDPEWQTYLGRKTNYDKWTDRSEIYQLETHELQKHLLAKLHKIDVAALSESVTLSYELLEQRLNLAIDDYQWRDYNYPVNQMFGEHSHPVSFLINQHQIDSLQDAKDYIARLNRLPEQFDTLVKGLERRREKGIIVPRFVIPHVLKTNLNIVQGLEDQAFTTNPIARDFRKKIDNLKKLQRISKRDHASLSAALENTLSTAVLEAYGHLNQYLRDLELHADDRAGVWKFPKGEEFYQVQLKRITTTDYTVEKIHEFGLSEVSRIHQRMDEIRRTVGFNGTLKDFMVYMRTAPEFYYPQTEDGKKAYLEKAQHYLDQLESQLPKLFETLPEAELKVKAVEPFREQAAGKAFYQRPAEDGSRPGIFYLNLYRMADMPLYQLEALAYHEGAPGHHMQLAIAQEIQGLPKFRRFGGYTAYTEGWGLYAEYLPKEVGMYQDPYSNFGRLAMELWRACRLVVDTGIHAKQWTREQAIEYYVSSTPNPPTEAIKMVERHIVMPGQATAYKIGMQKILELRTKAERQLQGAFDIREFHDLILRNGPVPLDVLENLVDSWISQQAI